MNALKILVVVTLTYSITVQAKELGNIQCGPSLSTGEMVVCDYAIIGSKYQKLYENHLSNGRNPILEASVQKEISECDGLSCVEQVIDKTMAQPVVDKEGAGSTQNALNQVTGAIGAKVTQESSTTLEQPKANLEKRDGVTNAENSTLSDEDRGAFGAWLMLAFIIALVLIGYKIVSFLRPKPNPNKAPAVGTNWLSLIWAGLAAAPSNPQGHDGNGNGGDSKVSEDKGHHTAPPPASQTGDVIYITPYNGPRHDGYEWDETYLKPYGASRHDGYEWDGTYLKPYGASRDDGYELSGLSMKPYDGSSSGRFESSAQVPIPVWAVVLGLVAKK